MPYSRCVRCPDCDGFPCLVHAKSDAEVLAVRPALEHPNVTLLTNAEAVALQHQPGRQRRDRGRGRPRRHPRDATGPTSSSSPAARPTRPSCCSGRPTTSTRMASPTAPTRWGATTCSTTASAVLALSRKENPTVFQKTLGLNDFYFGSDDFDYPLGNIQMVGKSQAPMYPGGEAGRDEAGAGVDARADCPPRGRLLALDRGPAASREPGDRQRRGKSR